MLASLPDYVPIPSGDPALAQALADLIPFSTTQPLPDEFPRNPPRVLVAAALDAEGPVRYLVAVLRSVGRSRSTSKGAWDTVVLERRPLPFPVEVHVLPRGWTPENVREAEAANVGQRPVRHGYDPGFSRLFHVFTPDGNPVPLPAALEDALMELAPCLTQGGSASPHLYDLNLRLTARGWGLCSPGAWLSRDLTQLVARVADRVSRALDQGGAGA